VPTVRECEGSAIARGGQTIRAQFDIHSRLSCHAAGGAQALKVTAMTLSRRHFLHLTMGGTAVAAASRLAQAETYPVRPVAIIVPYAAGGNTDIMARMAADWLSQKLGQPFVVENRAGAGGAIAAQYVASAAPDGYTLLFGTTAQTSIVPFIQKVRYDPLKDFAAVGVYGNSFSILAIAAAVPATDLKSFIDYAKSNPGQVNYASGGVGTVGHLVGASFAARAGLDMVHVPYKGGSQVIAGLLAGEVQMYFGNSSEILPYYHTDKLKILAVGTPARVDQMPDVPAVAEVYPGFSLPAWNGVLAPAGTPKDIVSVLSREIHAAAQDAPTAKRLRELGIEPGTATADELADIIRGEQTLYADAVKAAGITQQP
jgi:tripartite-type tricarboxylate transporter receptor subunit TctC